MDEPRSRFWGTQNGPHRPLATLLQANTARKTISSTATSAVTTRTWAARYGGLLRLQSLPMYGIARDVLKNPNYWADEPIGEDE
jgi:hypothetical protein